MVLIDQLDALGELMDQHSGRLSALLRLVVSLRDTPNLHVIVSCREFEFRHDVRPQDSARGGKSPSNVRHGKECVRC